MSSGPEFVVYNGLNYLPGTTAELVEGIESFPVAEDDVFIVGWPKSGTNWMSVVLANLYDHWATIKTTQDHIVPEFSTWSRPHTGLPGFEVCRDSPPPRLMKSHLPYSHMPRAFREGSGKAVFVMRNPKDVCDSLYAAMFHARGSDIYPWNEHVDAFLRGATAFGPWLDSVLGWHEQAGRPQVLSLTFEGVQLDQRRALEQIADFVGPVASDRFEWLLDSMDFEGMQRAGLDKQYQPGMSRRAGKIGGWKQRFTVEQSERFDELLDRPLRARGLELFYEVPTTTWRDGMERPKASKASGTATFEDWYAIHTLLMAYADLVDSGSFSEAAGLFEHATYRVAHDGDTPSGTEVHRGATEVEAYMSRTRRYADGTPRTKHVNTNVIIDVDGDVATSRCYLTVVQQTQTLPLQPIAAGRYVDRFERVDGSWRWADRLITGFLVGDTKQHKEP